jgi:hypothetical protein
MAGPQIRNYNSQDQHVLEVLLQKCWSASPESEWQLHLPKNDSVTLLAFDNQQLLGMMTRFERSFHPHTTTLEFGFDTALEEPLRWQLETLLFDQIAGSVAKDRIFRAQVLETQTRELWFLHDKGFLEMRRTWMPSVNVSSLPATLFEGALHTVLERGYSIHGLSELQNDSALMRRLIEANRDHYIATHAINPPCECDLNEWQTIAYNEDLIAEAACVALKNDQVAAFSSLCRSESEDACDVAWFASTPEYWQDSQVLNRALKAKELEYARTHGITHLNFEVDSTDPQSVALLEAMPIDRGLALLTYQTGIPKT